MPLCRIIALVVYAFAVAWFLPEGQAQPSNGITREVYANIAGSAITDLTGNAAYPNSPTSEEVLTDSFDCPVNYLDNYGQRLRALIVPPTTGLYTFWIASDDQSQLWLSTDATPATRQLIARVNT